MPSYLLIDDESEICFLLTNMLKRLGVECREAHSLEQGREALSFGPYDAVFVDVHLPDGLGYELIPEIRERYPGTRVIAISAVDQERTAATDRGADLFLAKPLSGGRIIGGLRDLGLT